MGRGVASREAYRAATTRHVPERGPATASAEQHVRKTGKLNPLVDPSGYGVIRASRPRFEQRSDGLWEMTVGTPVPIETRIDTTGSMGNSIDTILKAMNGVYELYSDVLPGCDPQIATGIFGDVSDPFVLCRPQFEMLADRIVEQLTLMVPYRDGGDFEEDPHYGLFGAAYLTAAYLHRIGLKSYDFTVTDASARDRLDERTLKRIFGDDVFAKVAENGHRISPSELPSTKDVVQSLLMRAHAFVLQVSDDSQTTSFWTRIFGRNRVVALSKSKYVPHVQAVIMGLTEGTLDLNGVIGFLKRHNVSGADAESIVRSVSNIPISAQAALPNFGKRPKQGDLFRNKTDLWPIPPEEVARLGLDGATDEPSDGAKTDWL